MHFLILLLALAFALSPIVSGDFGGFDANAFPVPQDDPPVQPAGWAFSIWGVIYLGLILHGLRGLGRRDHPDWRTTRVPLAISLSVGVVWIPVAKASPVWATVLILVMLGGALAALLNAGRGDRWTLGHPLGLYAGWLTAASSVSVGLLLAGYGVTGIVAAAWIALGIVAAIGAAVLLRRSDPGYAIALLWALLGIVVQNWGETYAVALPAATLAIILVVLAWISRTRTATAAASPT